MNEDQIKDYMERRKLIFCAAFGSAYAYWTAQGSSHTDAKNKALEIAQRAAESTPGAPGEEHR